MDGAAFEKSQNFIMRYRLWALINNIVEADANTTPIHKRTLRWLVERSLEKLRSDDPEFRDIAARYNDGEDGGDEESGESSSENEGGGANHPFRPRHISPSEVKGIYASQAEWLLAQQLAPRHKNNWKVNMKGWVEFCRNIQLARREAGRHGVRWGLPFGVSQVKDVPLAERLAQHGGEVKFWETKLQNLEGNWLNVEKKVSRFATDLGRRFTYQLCFRLLKLNLMKKSCQTHAYHLKFLSLNFSMIPTFRSHPRRPTLIPKMKYQIMYSQSVFPDFAGYPPPYHLAGLCGTARPGDVNTFWISLICRTRTWNSCQENCVSIW